MDNNIVVRVKDNIPIEVTKNTTLFEISKKYENRFKFPIIVAKVNNELQDLKKTPLNNSEIEFLDITDKYGFRAYQKTATFIMICAVKEVLGIETRVVIEHSINKNYFCKIISDIEITENLLENITIKMKEIVAKNYEIEKFSLPVEQAIELAKKFSLEDKVEILKYRKSSNVTFYKLSWFYNYFYDQLAPSTKYITKFKLFKKLDGFILQFPDFQDPTKLSEAEMYEKISAVFTESSKWARIINVNTVATLNNSICSGEIGNVIRISEALHEKKIASIADMIHEQNKKLVLIAGPSSSGKTTFSHRLGTQLKVNGLNPKIISIDDYFKDQLHTPGENSDYDFESIDAIDSKQLKNDLYELLNGKTINIPHFNFIKGKRENKNKYMSLDKNDILIVEGIHGLNEEISNTISKEHKFKIFISALTQINIDDHNRVSTSDTRIIRRIVRDYHFRKLDPQTTISMWPSVTKGEATNIFPYQEEADAVFNSALVYELSVLKPYIEPILFNINKNISEYTEAKKLLKFLDAFISINSNEVPDTSLLREFIGGSSYH